MGDLRNKAATCDICKLRWDAYRQRYPNGDNTSVTFNKVDSHLRLNHELPPILTILRYTSESFSVKVEARHGAWSSILSLLSLTHILEDPQNAPSTGAAHSQVGLPRLPTPGSCAHINILRHWLQACDKGHRDCVPTGQPTHYVPTRLIDVGSEGFPTVKLYETLPQDSMRYLALSHPWGSPPHFCTCPKNLNDHKIGISLELLPNTFRHAIQITRKLGLQYLWIDSICIIQGPEGDFNKMAKRMEDVFSQAYCVLAASSAKGQTDGFLKPRRQRIHHVVPCGDKNVPAYLCEFMDDFQSDVLEGPLSQRAWAFQERALARRTIFFTDTQTYWECGDGIQCETLTKLEK